MMYDHMDSFSDTIFKDGFKKDMEKGRLKGIEGMALSMLAGGEPLGKIARYSGIPLAEVEKLRQRNSAAQDPQA